MTLPAFDANKLISRLSKLDNSKQLVFGATCCERLLPNYLTFSKDTGWGNIEPIRIAMDLIWSILLGQQPNMQYIDKMIETCENEGPDSDDFNSFYVSFAQDACFAVCGLLDFLQQNDVKKIVQAATYAIDSVDLYVQEIENIEPNDPLLEQKILNHQLMQRELEIQNVDLTYIEQITPLTNVVIRQLSEKHRGISNLGLSGS